MSYRCQRPGYDVRVDGLFLTRSRFVIHAVVAYESRLTDAERERAELAAQTELLVAIAGESQRARGRGAQTVHVTVDGDPGMDRFFRRRRRLIGRSSATTTRRPAPPSPAP
jgi:hypothetical protein